MKAKELVTRKEYENACAVIAAYRKQLIEKRTDLETQIKQIDALGVVNSEMRLVDLEMSVRLFNLLVRYNQITRCWGELNHYDYIKDIKAHQLSEISKKDFKKLRGVGKKNLQEFERLLIQIGIESKP